MSTLAYEIVDVFTDRPFAGNPLAVVFGAEALAGDQMQTLAREFNLSETVFVLPPTTPDATYRARIFTPDSELPFAGHPSVGAAVTVMRRGLAAPGPVVQECGAGLLPIQVTEAGSATLTGGTPTLGDRLDPEPLLALVGLTAEDFAGEGCPAAACGMRARVRLPAGTQVSARPHQGRGPGAGRAAEGVADQRVRLGSRGPVGAGPGVLPRRIGPGGPGDRLGRAGAGRVAGRRRAGCRATARTSYTVHQGIEMGRPSLLECTVTAVGGRASSATVAGHVVPIAKGEITVPPFIG